MHAHACSQEVKPPAAAEEAPAAHADGGASALPNSAEEQAAAEEKAAADDKAAAEEKAAAAAVATAEELAAEE